MYDVSRGFEWDQTFFIVSTLNFKAPTKIELHTCLEQSKIWCLKLYSSMEPLNIFVISTI